MRFEHDAFISYAHLDNEPLEVGGTGWVSNLNRGLEKRVSVKIGIQANIFRDPTLKGNDVFAEKIYARLRRAASLVAVVSESYVNSKWTSKELHEFCRAVKEQNVQLGEMSRIFKVLKNRVPLENQPPELQSLLGYEFYKVDPDTGKAHEFDPEFGRDAQLDFYSRVEDLAHDISELWKKLVPSPAPVPQAASVYLAQTTSDLRDQRDAIKRDLQEHGHSVFPARELPLVAPELAGAVREDLAKCQMSIHLIGKSYSLVPEGETKSLLEIQNELAIERGEKGGFSRLIWIPAGQQVEDGRQSKVIERLRMDTRVQKGTDLLETALENLKTEIYTRLVPPSPVPPPRNEKDDISQLYLIYDQRDANLTPPYADYLFKKGFEVITPMFEGDEAEVREYNDENLHTCDGALMLYGAASQKWLRGKFAEVKKSVGYGRTKPRPVVAIALMPPKKTDKEHFQTHFAEFVIPQWNGFSPDSLQPFISRLSA